MWRVLNEFGVDGYLIMGINSLFNWSMVRVMFGGRLGNMLR